MTQMILKDTQMKQIAPRCLVKASDPGWLDGCRCCDPRFSST